MSPLLAQAFSGFYYTFYFLNLTNGQPLSVINATIWGFCTKGWKEVRFLLVAAKSSAHVCLLSCEAPELHDKPSKQRSSEGPLAGGSHTPHILAERFVLAVYRE